MGAWHGSILPGITQKLNSVVSEALGTEYTSEQEADLWLNAVFNKDGTFTISMDEDATAASLTGYMEALRPTIVELCYQEAEKQGMTREEYDKALEASDLTVEGLVDTILSALDPAALLGAIGDSSITGYYKLTAAACTSASAAAALPRRTPPAATSAAMAPLCPGTTTTAC